MAFLAVATALLAGGALLFRRWPLAYAAARVAFVAAAAASVLPLLVVLLMWVAPRPSGWIVVGLLVGDTRDPATHVRTLAEGVSALVACGAVAVPALVLSALLWRLAGRRLANT